MTSCKFEDFLTPLCHTNMAILLRPSYMVSQNLQTPPGLALFLCDVIYRWSLKPFLVEQIFVFLQLELAHQTVLPWDLCPRLVFPNLLKVAEHLTIKLSENPSYLESNFIFKHNILWISNFSGSTSKLLTEHLWSPDQWLGPTGLDWDIFGSNLGRGKIYHYVGLVKKWSNLEKMSACIVKSMLRRPSTIDFY